MSGSEETLLNIFTKAKQVNVNKVIQSGNSPPSGSSLIHLLCSGGKLSMSAWRGELPCTKVVVATVLNSQ